MDRKDEDVKWAGQEDDSEKLEPELREALGDFKLSVEAWSEAMMSRPRQGNGACTHELELR